MFTLVDDFCHLLKVTRLCCEYGCHIFGGEVGFHVGGLVGYSAIACGMSFVETVSGKWFDPVPKLGGFFERPTAMLYTATDKSLLLRLHFCRDFFTYRFSEFVCLSPTIASYVNGD